MSLLRPAPPASATTTGSDAVRRTPRTAVTLGLVVASIGAVAAVLAARGSGGGSLTVPSAVLLGVVEGLTEWLPISSTGHLTVTQSLLGIQGRAAASYAIAIQAGAILAVLTLYPQRFVALLRGVAGRDREGRRLLLALVAASLPAGVVGLLFEDVIKTSLFGPGPVAAAWIVGGLAILLVAHHRRDLAPTDGHSLDTLTWRAALVVGAAQVLALWPGVSRSLVTILAATSLGLAVPAAVEFSFLLGFVVLSAATAYETLSAGPAMLDAYGAATPMVGLAVAFVSALVAMRWMVAYLQRHGLGIFGWYRIAIGLGTLGLLTTSLL